MAEVTGGDAGDDACTIDRARFRQVVGHFATGVAVVTVFDHDEPFGLAVNSFTSVSLSPPMVSFCVALDSSTLPHLRSARGFCVNILEESQEDVCRLFATKGAERFGAIGWRRAESGAPVLSDVLAWIDCRTEAEHPAGDHVILVGRVLDLQVVHEGRPLLFYRGGYGRFEP